MIYANVHTELTGPSGSSDETKSEEMIHEGLAKVCRVLITYKRSFGSAFAWVQRVAQNRMRDLSRKYRRDNKAIGEMLRSVERDPYIQRRLLGCRV